MSKEGIGFQALFKEALLALRVNKARSLLTVLGIVIGVAAVIIMINLGQGASANITNQIEKMGSNLLMINPGASGAQVRGSGGTVNNLTWDDAQAIARLQGVEAVAPEVNIGVTAAWANQTWVTSATGTTPEEAQIMNRSISAGRFFDEQDVAGAANVAVVGETIAANLFPLGVDPVGQTIRLNKISFQVIGVLSPMGATLMGRDADDLIYIPLSTAQIRLLGTKNVRAINVQAKTPADLDRLPDSISALLRERHHLPPYAEDDFTIRNLTAILETAQNAAGIMTTLLAGVAAVSLLVGGIGIMNIMLVSVTERTREIGIRKAIGATESAIMRQFLTESVVLSLTGGVIGIITGISTGYLISAIIKWPTAISPAAILLSMLFSASVGIFFGYYPSRRAAALDPVEALRYG